MTETTHSKEYKKLYRSTSDLKITGLLGGIGEYFNIDPTIIRLAVAFIIVCTGVIPGTLMYLLASWIVPKNEERN
ncbi:PspC domain-containing protein [Candidatus Nomurabacteria bacterium]|nr:PspC domain-containing protein [Candidatus Nomurabacteria bacterium]